MSVISGKYKGKHCEECGVSVNITRDHIIPKWLERRFEYFGLDVYIVSNEQYLCGQHNQNKGGKIDYRDERVRRFLKKFVEMLTNKINSVEKEIRAERFRETMADKKTKQKDDKETDGVKF